MLSFSLLIMGVTSIFYIENYHSSALNTVVELDLYTSYMKILGVIKILCAFGIWLRFSLGDLSINSIAFTCILILLLTDLFTPIIKNQHLTTFFPDVTILVVTSMVILGQWHYENHVKNEDKSKK